MHFIPVSKKKHFPGIFGRRTRSRQLKAVERNPRFFAEGGKESMRRQKEDLMREMNDRQLESQTNHEIWLSEITVRKSRAEDVWRRTPSKDECERHGKLEMFKGLKQRLLTKISWGKTPMIE